MASEVKTDKLSPSGGTALQIGDASDTITIPTGATFTITDGLGVAGGGTGLVSFTAGDVLYATGSTTLAKLAKGTAEEILSMNSGATAPEWTTAAATAGGTGQTGFTAGDLLYANSTTTLTKLGKGTARQGLQTNSGATAPEWVNSPQSLMTAEGDIIYASGANTLAKLAKGSDDEVLTLASGVPSWAESAGGGKVLQVLQDTLTDATSTTSVTFEDITGLTIDITPSATTSKILVMVSTNSWCTAGTAIFFSLVRDSTEIFIGDVAGDRARISSGAGNTGAANRSQASSSIIYLDSPSSTSALTYKVQWRVAEATTGYFNYTNADTDNSSYPRAASSITVMEIGA